MNFFNFLTFLNFLSEILKRERNVVNFVHVFVTKYHNIVKKFSDVWVVFNFEKILKNLIYLEKLMISFNKKRKYSVYLFIKQFCFSIC